jgi:hypothetical protein
MPAALSLPRFGGRSSFPPTSPQAPQLPFPATPSGDGTLRPHDMNDEFTPVRRAPVLPQIERLPCS